MIQTFLRSPRGAAELAADGVRALGLLSIAVALVFWSPVDVAVFALGLLGLVVPRFFGIRPALDAAFGITVLVAAWSALFDLYENVLYWDLLVHFALNGVTAAVIFVAAGRVGILADPSGLRLSAIVALTTSFGLAAGAVWEVAEWLGHTFVDTTIFVSYRDTIGDLAAGGLGSLLAGLGGPFFTAKSRFVATPQPEPSAAP